MYTTLFQIRARHLLTRIEYDLQSIIAKSIQWQRHYLYFLLDLCKAVQEKPLIKRRKAMLLSVSVGGALQVGSNVGWLICMACIWVLHSWGLKFCALLLLFLFLYWHSVLNTTLLGLKNKLNWGSVTRKKQSATWALHRNNFFRIFVYFERLLEIWRWRGMTLGLMTTFKAWLRRISSAFAFW